MKSFLGLMAAGIFICVMTLGAIAFHDIANEGPDIEFERVLREGIHTLWINEYNDKGYYAYDNFETYAECAEVIGNKIAALEQSAARINESGGGNHIQQDWVIAANLEHAIVTIVRAYSDGRVVHNKYAWKCLPVGENGNPL